MRSHTVMVTIGKMVEFFVCMDTYKTVYTKCFDYFLKTNHCDDDDVDDDDN